MMQHKGGKTSNRLPCTFPESGGDWALMGWGWGRFMVGPEVWLRWFSHTLSGAVCGHHAWYPAFAPGTSESLGFGLYHLIVHNLPRVHMHAVIFFVPYHFFVFCCLRRQLSRYKCAEFLNHVRLFATPWTVAHQAPVSMGILQVKILECVAMPSSRESSWPRDWTQVSHTVGGFFTIWTTREAHPGTSSAIKGPRSQPVLDSTENTRSLGSAIIVWRTMGKSPPCQCFCSL